MQVVVAYISLHFGGHTPRTPRSSHQRGC